MRLHLWDGHSGRTWCGLTGRGEPLAVAKVREVKAGILIEHCADDLPKRVCGRCSRGFRRRLRRKWWWKRVGGGKWLAAKT